MQKAMTGGIIENTLLNAAFIFTVFILRKIDDKFSMNWELQRITFAKCVLDTIWIASLLFFTETWFVVFGFFQYFEVLLCLCILWISVIEPIRDTYKVN